MSDKLQNLWRSASLAWMKVATEPEERNGRLVPWSQRLDVKSALAITAKAGALQAKESGGINLIHGLVSKYATQATPTPKKVRKLRCSKCDKPGHNRARCREVERLAK